MRTMRVVVIAVVLALASWVYAQGLPAAAPKSVGMSSERLARLTRVMHEYTRTRQIAGTVTLVARSGRIVYHEAAGLRDIEQNSPMQKDTIFRIASQTKALSSVGIMMLDTPPRSLVTSSRKSQASRSRHS